MDSDVRIKKMREVNPYVQKAENDLATAGTEFESDTLDNRIDQISRMVARVLEKTDYLDRALEKVFFKTTHEEIKDIFLGRCTTFSEDLKRVLRRAGFRVNVRKNPNRSHTYLSVGRGENTIIIDPTMPQIIKGFKGVAILSWSQLESLVLDTNNSLYWGERSDRRLSIQSIWGYRSGRNNRK